MSMPLFGVAFTTDCRRLHKWGSNRCHWLCDCM